MKEFCKKVIPDLSQKISSPSWLHGHAILAQTKKEVETINDLFDQMVPGRSSVSVVLIR